MKNIYDYSIQFINENWSLFLAGGFLLAFLITLLEAILLKVKNGKVKKEWDDAEEALLVVKTFLHKKESLLNTRNTELLQATNKVESFQKGLDKGNEAFKALEKEHDFIVARLQGTEKDLRKQIAEMKIECKKQAIQDAFELNKAVTAHAGIGCDTFLAEANSFYRFYTGRNGQ